MNTKVCAALDRTRRNGTRTRVVSKHPCGATKCVARKLIQQNNGGELRARRFGPTLPRSGFNHRRERFLNMNIHGWIFAEPQTHAFIDVVSIVQRTVTDPILQHRAHVHRHTSVIKPRMFIVKSASSGRVSYARRLKLPSTRCLRPSVDPRSLDPRCARGTSLA